MQTKVIWLFDNIAVYVQQFNLCLIYVQKNITGNWTPRSVELRNAARFNTALTAAMQLATGDRAAGDELLVTDLRLDWLRLTDSFRLDWFTECRGQGWTNIINCHWLSWVMNSKQQYELSKMHNAYCIVALFLCGSVRVGYSYSRTWSDLTIILLYYNYYHRNIV